MSNPVTFASDRQYVGLGVETVQGTAVVPAVTMPVDSFDPFDQPNFIMDDGLRGSMTDTYNVVQGVEHTEFSMAGAAYLDTFGYLLANMFGDVTYSGTYTGSGTTTLSESSDAGDTTISVEDSIASGTLIQIDTGVNAEVRTTSGVSGGGPYVLTVPALAKPHAAAVAVKPVTTPNSALFALLNSGNGQPSSLTITDYQGPTASTGTRAYAGCCLSELDLTATIDTTALTYEARGLGWPSAPAAAFTSSPSAVAPQPAWEAAIGIGGTVSGSLVLTVNELTLNLTRELTQYFTAANTQNPYQGVRGKLNGAGTLNFVVANETPLADMLDNTQPQIQVILSNGGSGSSLLALQVDIEKAAYVTSKISRGNVAVEYAVEFDTVANTTNTGYSAGFGPLTMTLQNAVAANSY